MQNNQFSPTKDPFAFFGAIFLFFSFFSVVPKKILAQSFSSPSYRINWGNFNITSGQKSSANYQLTDTVGQNAPGQYDSFGESGYTLKAGFQYIYDTFFTFSFQIDDLAIDLGALSVGIASTDTNIITVSAPSGQGYQILTQQNHPLQTLSAGVTIPDTICDNSLCTPSQSDTWTQTNTYGFGFNAIGINNSGVATHIGTSAYFSDQNYFRPFADFSSGQISQTIMSESSPAQNRQARITYKANISSLQPAGDYQNAIIFTAVPHY